MSLAARISQQVRHAVSLASQPLYWVGGEAVALADGYVPLWLDYTHEDRAAKGLRAFEPGQQKAPPAYFSAAQLLAEAPLLLLHGPAGSGKSTLARHLQWQQAQALADETARAQLPVYIEAPQPLLTAGDGLLQQALDAGQAVLLVIDNAEQWQGPALFAELQALTTTWAHLRVLVLGRSEPCSEWTLGNGWQRHGVLPLQAQQRQAFIGQRWPALVHGFAAHGDAALVSRPAAFALALGAGAAPDPLALAERWCQAGGQGLEATALFASRYLQGLLDTRPLRLADSPALARQLRGDTQRWNEPLLLWGLARVRAGDDIAGLIDALPSAGPHGVLLACELLDAHSPAAPANARAPLLEALLTLVEQGRERLSLRVRAAQVLARWGDPRDLQALVSVAAGVFTLGSERHPNSAPVATLALPAFRIARYPVVNRDYLRFVEATGRPWRSVDGRHPERANAPAVDLTWHDAQAYCAWLSQEWRGQGRLGADEVVRLPTEPQWEYAARGQQGAQAQCDVYPWPGGWHDGHGNGEEASLNTPCAVGLFPLGRSPWGCDDLCGQVWEWTSTLWGEDMAKPRFAYPYADDGREALQAPPQVRRVLRGGCFSSPGFKACCTYRGSLEPDGFWRGNGFRVVVAPA